MPSSGYVLAIDLGTSRVKVGVVDQSLRTLASASASYDTLSIAPDMAEQRTSDWLEGIRRSVTEVLSSLEDDELIGAVVLTAQMPTLVALTSDGQVIGNAVTWQDSRADGLVATMLTPVQQLRVAEIAGTPIDGRYIIPMHLLRSRDPSYAPARLLSAKDYLVFMLTGQFLTDPSTASGFGNYDLVTRTWSEELNALWSLDPGLLPDVVEPFRSVPLTVEGARLLPGVDAVTPVFVGAADSVSAHYFVTSRLPGAISVIDGSSTVIMATIEHELGHHTEMLRTPLVEGTGLGAEMDLLASGSSVGWLARLFEMSPGELEDLALAHPNPASNPILLFPYLAGGEQGALWRTDLSGMVSGLTLATSRADLALAVFEGIAFETLRCLRLLLEHDRSTPVVALTGSASRRLVPAILSVLLEHPVLAVGHQSPSLLGVAAIALEGIGVRTLTDATLVSDEIPALNPAYVGILHEKAARYFAASPDTSITHDARL